MPDVFVITCSRHALVDIHSMTSLNCISQRIFHINFLKQIPRKRLVDFLAIFSFSQKFLFLLSMVSLSLNYSRPISFSLLIRNLSLSLSISRISLSFIALLSCSVDLSLSKHNLAHYRAKRPFLVWSKIPLCCHASLVGVHEVI